ncbi:hypothetical protein [Streptomyces sp. NRRL F-5126]|uniref:hypothetical protein n=1 Tax=Streptomyces sp. NRRL F-5126 TaxID=1463857 RepID=UPI0004C93F24|nr:hypothetical protein [Streptomyces sp. NRRL F-5126]
MSSSDHEDVERDAGDEVVAVGLTPRQARMIRVTMGWVVLAGMAVLLWVRLEQRQSVLVMGVYGLAMVVCGVVIELSRHGRTRLGTYLLGLVLVAALGADWLLP